MKVIRKPGDGSWLFKKAKLLTYPTLACETRLPSKTAADENI
jgi:hypothetical protein